MTDDTRARGWALMQRYSDEARAEKDRIQEERDRAVIARIGGNVYRHEGGVCRARGYTVAETDEYIASEVRHVVNNRKASRRAYLPEAAFDWPVYQAALYQSTEDCQSNGHRDPLYAESVIERYQRESR
jgi:hypothetical protein